MEINKLCMGCMKEFSDDSEYCEYCGYKKGTPNSSRGLQPQTILNGKYLVGKVIGEGGFGITYIAYDLVLNYRVAIKEYFPTELVTRDTSTGAQTSLTVLTDSKEEQYKKGINRFIREAGNLAKFNNLTGIVSVKEFFYENNTAYMVMEHIDGVTLSEYLDNNGGKLPYTKVIEMMNPIMESLVKVHAAGIVHRDISPDNIMVTNDGKMKLIDFGAARLVENNDVKSLTVILKHGYAPEEQYQPEGNQGAWTDIYALAATMYRMITGMVPQESTDRVLSGDKVVSVNKLFSDVPKRVSDAIMHGLAVKVSDRPKKISDFKAELETGRRPKSVFYLGIVVAVVALIVVAGILLSNRGGVKADDSEDTVIRQSIQADETQDVKTTAEEVLPKEKTETELVSMIEEVSGQRVAFSEFEDFDEDGYKELYSLTVSQNDDEDLMGDSGQIWYADVEGAVRVMDTGVSSEYTYSESSTHGLLHFGETTHFYIESQSDESDSESLSFGVVDGRPKVIFQGNAVFFERANGVFLDNQYAYDKFAQLEQSGNCKVLYIDGQYLGCGLSPMSMAQFNSISGMNVELEKAMSQLKEFNEAYPYKVFENAYYSADDCIYINTICLRSEEDYEDYKLALHLNSGRKRDLEDIDYLKCALVFTRQSSFFCFSEIEENVPAETSALPLFYKSADFWNQDTIDIDNLSDEETKEVLMHQLYDHFSMQDEELEELSWGDNSELIHISEFSQWEVSGSVLDDFDNDGSKELMAYINADGSDWCPICGIYYIDNSGIVTMCQGKGSVDTQIRDIEEFKFGKKELYSFFVEHQLDSDTLLYGTCTDGIIKYDQLWSEGDNSLNISSNDDGIVLSPYWDVVYNLKTGEIICGGINQMADSFIDTAQIWFVDGKFVECASIKIDESSFLNMKGAQSIVDNIDKYAVEVLKNDRNNNFSNTAYLYDFGIESILYCADGYIYINYLPMNNQSRYGDTYYEGFVETLPSVVLKVEVAQNEVKLRDVYRAYKTTRLTKFQPYYPQNDVFAVNDVLIDEDTVDQDEEDTVLQTTAGEIKDGDTIIVHVIVDDHYEFRYGEGCAIILRFDNPVDLHYLDMEGEDSIWQGFSDNLFVNSDESADGGWNQYNGKLIRCKVNRFVEAATGGMIADVNEIVEVLD